MKKATKVLALILAMAMMACTLVACGSSADTTAATETADTEAVTETEDAAADTEEAAPAEGGTITFGTNAEFPPFEFVTANGVIGEFDGIDMALAKQIAE